MRTLTLLAATVLVATISGAQTPLTIDPTFEYFITPEWIEQWESRFSISDIALRPEGEIITSGNHLHPPGGVSGGPAGGTLLVDGSGAFVDSPFQSQGGSGKISMLTNLQYFYGYKRWNTTGERDFSFGQPGIPFIGLSDWHVFPDRSVLVGGRFKLEEDGLIEYGLIKVDEWGALDTTFTARKIGPGTSLDVERIHPLENGQYLLSGSFTTYEGEFSGPVLRINPDGSRDAEFYFPAWKGEVAAIHEQPDGKLILGGRFFMNDIPDTLKLVRVFHDGSLDHSFNNLVDYRTGNSPFSAMASGLNVLTPLNDGRFVVGGVFTHVDGQPRGCIACTDTLGNLLDCWAGGGLVPQDYTPGGGPIFGLGGFKCLSNGDCYIFGEYKGFIDANGLHARQCLMSRIYMPDVGVNEISVVQGALEVWPNPGVDQVLLKWPDQVIQEVIIRDANSKVVLTRRSTALAMEVDDLPTGAYSIEVRSSAGYRTTAKWIKQ